MSRTKKEDQQITNKIEWPNFRNRNEEYWYFVYGIDMTEQPTIKPVTTVDKNGKLIFPKVPRKKNK